MARSILIWLVALALCGVFLACGGGKPSPSSPTPTSSSAGTDEDEHGVERIR